MPVTTTRGIDLYYEIHGAGDDLLLIQGLGSAVATWRDLLPRLSSAFRCIVFDNRGVGRSSMPPGPYTTRDMAEDAIAVLDAVGVRRAHVYGVSMGGAIAQEIALVHPHRVKRLALCCTWAEPDQYTRRVFDVFTEVRACADELTFKRMQSLLCYSHGYFQSSYAALQARECESQGRASEEVMRGFTAQATACATHSTLDRLHAIATSTLVMVGDADVFTPLTYAQDIAQRIPNASLKIFPGCGHNLSWEAGEEFVHTCLRFFGEGV